MTTYLERDKIERDSQSDPLAPPAGSTQADVEASVVLLRRVRSTILDIANDKLHITPIPTSGPDRDAIGWARDVTTQPDAFAIGALRLLLAQFDAMTPAQILDGTIPDSTFRTAVDEMVPALVLGSDVRR
jgi:hypothetical protein